METADHIFGVTFHESAKRFGYRTGSKGTHTSRTIMLAELSQVLDAVPLEGGRADYATAIIDHNVTDKKTVATRRLTSQRLGELYGLDPSIVVFRSLRRFWDADPSGRPLLAQLCSLARDPLLRATAPVVLAVGPGGELFSAGAESCRTRCGRRSAERGDRRQGRTERFFILDAVWASQAAVSAKFGNALSRLRCRWPMPCCWDTCWVPAADNF